MLSNGQTPVGMGIRWHIQAFHYPHAIGTPRRGYYSMSKIFKLNSLLLEAHSLRRTPSAQKRQKSMASQ
jgi:hypothetical protein